MNEKHLEFIQSNITRMNQCSFQMKGWTLTIIAALLAIFAGTIGETGVGNNYYILIAIIPTVMFWILDSYYLSIERKFVSMYNDVAGLTKETQLKDFEINPKKYKGWRYCIINTMFCSISTLAFYGVLTVGLIFLGILL